jgi:hypothetical protein
VAQTPPVDPVVSEPAPIIAAPVATAPAAASVGTTAVVTALAPAVTPAAPVAPPMGTVVAPVTNAVTETVMETAVVAPVVTADGPDLGQTKLARRSIRPAPAARPAAGMTEYEICEPAMFGSWNGAGSSAGLLFSDTQLNYLLG